ncbi:MAG: redox-sensitive bicupin YhaK (pirin superfamily) [Myxococcota bacterium]|jgi:redox-sensitive bicupin YhaK (pirin superfamily)
MGQNADLYRVLLPAEAKVTQSVSRLRSWVQVVTGTVTVNGVLLQPGDGLAMEAAEAVAFIVGDSAVEALLFDLP